MPRHANIHQSIFLAALVFACAGSLCGQQELSGSDYLRWYQAKYLSGQGVSHTPEELLPVMQDKQNHDYESVIRKTTELINRDANAFYSPPYANWVKSLAHIERGAAKAALSGKPDDDAPDLAEAAKLGNLRAATTLGSRLFEKMNAGSEDAAARVNVDDLVKYLRIGAELGEPWSAAHLVQVPKSLTQAEGAYWTLLSIGKESDTDADFRNNLVHWLYSQVGADGVEHALKQLSPLGGTLKSGAVSGLPGRGVMATAYADAVLRREYSYNYGKRQPKEHTAASPSTLEVFKAERAFADLVGHASVYMLVPGSRKFSDPAIISIPASQIATYLSPSDMIVVGCGDLVHMARIYRLDPSAGTVDFVDGLFEYWQSSHNSCISKFQFVPFIHGGYLIRVPLRDVAAIVQAVMTSRDRVLPPPTGNAEPADGYVTLAELKASEFFRFFHIQQVNVEQLDRGEQLVRYMTGAYQDKIFMSVRLDPAYRIADAVISVDRDWLGALGKFNPLGSDVVKSFIGAVTPNASAGAVQPLVRAIWGKTQPETSGIGKLMQAYDGTLPHASLDLPTGNLMLESLKESSGIVLKVTMETNVR